MEKILVHTTTWMKLEVIMLDKPDKGGHILYESP